MSNPQYGDTDVPEQWAVRIENNGEFIHANPKTIGVQGSENVIHGSSGSPCPLCTTDHARGHGRTCGGADQVPAA